MLFLSFFITLLIVVQTILAYENNQEYSVRCLGHFSNCELVSGKIYHPNSHAFGTYSDEVNKDGWGKLWVHGDATLEGWYQAGFLEGALTSERIYQHYISWYDYQFGSTPPSSGTIKFIYDQYDFAKRLSVRGEKEDSTDLYYSTLRKLLAQFQGILDGQNYAAVKSEEKVDLLGLLLLEAAGDLYDIIPATDKDGFKLHIGKLSVEEFFDRWHKQISCSALIKLSDNHQDVFAGHTSWTSYQNMLRVYKNYDLDAGLYQSSHSSKPGVIYSKDDFYVLPRNKLLVMETTNGVMDAEIYKLVTPESLLTWQRLPVVNALAGSGKEWVDLVSRYNSGTYANQWMVVDMKLFTPGKGVAKKDFLWIVELAPGLAVANDVTQVMLKQGGYWPSYNIPYDRKVFVYTGFQQAYDTYGDQYSYSNSTRALMFARDEGKVQSVDSMKKILRYNDYLNDPLSAGNAAAAISSRYDLRTTSAKTYGGVDTKVTSYSRMMGRLGPGEGYSSAECGPTHDNLSPFQWSTSGFDQQVHVGQPDVFNFGFVEMHFGQH